MDTVDPTDPAELADGKKTAHHARAASQSHQHMHPSQRTKHACAACPKKITLAAAEFGSLHANLADPMDTLGPTDPAELADGKKTAHHARATSKCHTLRPSSERTKHARAACPEKITLAACEFKNLHANPADPTATVDPTDPAEVSEEKRLSTMRMPPAPARPTHQT